MWFAVMSASVILTIKPGLIKPEYQLLIQGMKYANGMVWIVIWSADACWPGLASHAIMPLGV